MELFRLKLKSLDKHHGLVSSTFLGQLLVYYSKKARKILEQVILSFLDLALLL